MDHRQPRLSPHTWGVMQDSVKGWARMAPGAPETYTCHILRPYLKESKEHLTRVSKEGDFSGLPLFLKSYVPRYWLRHHLPKVISCPMAGSPRSGKKGFTGLLDPQQCHPETCAYLPDVVTELLLLARHIPWLPHPG